MKKSLVVIFLVVLFASTLTAAAPSPKLHHTLQGPLSWKHNSICGVSDYVALPVMTNVYLTGNFEPTRGILQGCQISATGFYYNAGYCSYFAVDHYQLTCAVTPSSSGSDW